MHIYISAKVDMYCCTLHHVRIRMRCLSADNIDSPLAVDAALEGLVQSLVQQEGAPNVAASCGDFGPNVLQHLAHHLLLSGQCWNSYMVAQYLCCRACDPAHDLSRMEICHAWVRLADAAYKLGGHKVAMLSYGRACSQTPSHAVSLPLQSYTVADLLSGTM